MDGSRIYPHKRVNIKKGTKIYRNYDIQLSRALRQSKNCRKIDVEIKVGEWERGLLVRVVDEEGVESSCRHVCQRMEARNPEKTIPAMEKQMKKSGETLFVVRKVTVEVSKSSYYSASVINEARRLALRNHLEKRIVNHNRPDLLLVPNSFPWPGDTDSDLHNIHNARALAFYKRHGVEDVVNNPVEDLMTCKYCIKKQLKMCPKDGDEEKYKEPFVLKDKRARFSLLFDCGKCEMRVVRL